MEYVDARLNLPKIGPEIFKRVCKAGMKCAYSCEHGKPHIVSLLCGIRCCDHPGKDVRCIPIGE